MNQRRHYTPGPSGLHRQPLMGQQEQMTTLGGIQLEGPREVVEESGGHTDVPPLLEPGVPGQTHSRQSGDLLATQPGRAPSAPGG
ncbi:hypothetical protein D3C78_1482250 [compost metagenome]